MTKRIGKPISVTIPPELDAWLRARKKPGGTLTEVIRDLLLGVMNGELTKPCAINHCYRHKARKEK